MHDDGDGQRPRSRFSGALRRRTFLKIAGGTGVVMAADPGLAGTARAQVAVDDDGVDVVVDPDWGPIYFAGRSFSTTIRRPADMVRLEVEGYNLRIDRTQPATPRLRLVNTAVDGGLVVTFPPQSLLEEAVPSPASVPSNGSIDARLSGPSRLSFIVPKDRVGAGIPYTIEALLDWSRWWLNTSLAARHAAGDVSVVQQPRPANPGPRETSIEVPWWLQISPNRRGGFVSTHHPVVGEGSGHTELWHTRFATRPGIVNLGPLTEGPSIDRTIRAVWSPDPDVAALLADPLAANAGGQPFVTTLSQRDRIALIRLTSDSVLPNSATGRVAVPVKTLTLSAIGATFQAGRSFAPASEISLVDWRHRSSLGRDQFVRVVNRGYLLPFGHSASQVTITERKFVGNGTARTAVLERRQFLVVNDSTIEHDGAAEMPTGGRQVPFSRVHLPGFVSPDITRSYLIAGNQDCYFPQVGGQDLQFHATAIDREGRRVDLQMPMAFVDGAVADGPLPPNPDRIAPIRAAWNAYSSGQYPDRRWARLSGQRVAYAAPLVERPGSTSLVTQRIRFDVTGLADEGVPSLPGRRRFWASMDGAEVELGEIAAVSGNQISPKTIVYDDVYRNQGFAAPANAGGLWGQILGDAIPLRFSRPPESADQPGPGSDRAGAAITPDLRFRALSRSLGVAAGDTQALRAGTFDASSFFAGPDAPKLLGGIPLIDVIDDVALPAGAVAPTSAMTITTRTTPDAVESAIMWTPALKSDPEGIFTPGSFVLDAVVRTPLDGSSGAPSSRVDGELSNFTINIPSGASPLLMLDVDRLHFSARDGRPPDLDVDVGDVRFGGELAYIAALSEYLDFGDGGIDIAALPDRIEVSVALALPAITFGVFTLRNVRFAAGFDVPYSGDPVRIRFSLATRDDPFRMTVLCIGGGGYVVLAFGPDGLEALELGLEAGAEIALDLGVASGSISAMFGAVLMVGQDQSGDTAAFLAYFRMNGSVSAGPVSASVTLHLELGYRERTKNGKTVSTLYGRGSIEIDISVPLLPSPPVTITIERSFKSDAADPTFGDQLGPSDWNDYCDAYGAA